MDNLTHSLIGLTAAKAGLEKLSPGTTALCMLAANAPDADLVVRLFRDEWSYLHHHRGITHSIVGTLTLSLALPLVFYLADLLIARIRKRRPTVKLRGLIIASVIVTATHPLLDWSNNYGVRFLLPWSPRWSYGDFLFVLDPVFWITLGGAAFLLTSKTKKQIGVWLLLAAFITFLVFFGPTERGGLANATFLRILWITALVALVVLFWLRVGKRWGTRIGIAAFALIVVYMSSMFFVQKQALAQANREAAMISVENAERIVEVAAMPVLANPFNWLCVVETERAAYKFSLSLASGRGRRNELRFEKPEGLPPQFMSQSVSDRRAGIFLNFARFPVARIADEDCVTQTFVQFADLRYTEPGQNRGLFTLELPVACPVVESMTR
jgi:inner membrane protein